MRQRGLTWQQCRAAADECRVGRRVMGRAERPFATQSRRAQGRQLAGHALDDGYLERLIVVEWRQQAWDGSCEESLASTRRPDHEQVVATREGDLQSPPCVALAANIEQINRLELARECLSPCAR